MELDFIYEENHIVEYSTEDLLLDTEYVNEGVLSNIWEKVKKFFKAIKDFVVKYFNKFLDLFRKKSTKVTPNDVKACEETLKDPKAYTDNSKDDKEDSTPNGDTDPVMDDVEEPTNDTVAKKGKKFIKSKTNRKIVRRAKLSKDKTFKVKTIMVNGERVKDLLVIFQEDIYTTISDKGAADPLLKLNKSIRLEDLVGDKADEFLGEAESAHKKIKESCVYSEVDGIIDMDFVTKNFKTIIKMMDQKYISDLIKGIKDHIKWYTDNLEARVDPLKKMMDELKSDEEANGLHRRNYDAGIKSLNLIMSSSKLMVDFVIKLVTTQLMHANKVAIEIYNYVKACADYRKYESLREYTELDEFYGSDLINEDVEGLDLNIDDEYITEIEDRQYFDSQYILSIINRGA